jgi:hypothetical protein
MATVVGRSEDELRSERDVLLDRAGLGEEDFRERARYYQLTSEQMDLPRTETTRTLTGQQRVPARR